MTLWGSRCGGGSGLPPRPPQAPVPSRQPRLLECGHPEHRPGLKICMSGLFFFLAWLLLQSLCVTSYAPERSCRRQRFPDWNTAALVTWPLLNVFLSSPVPFLCSLFSPPPPAVAVKNILYYLHVLMGGFIFSFVHSCRVYNCNQKTSFLMPNILTEFFFF